MSGQGVIEQTIQMYSTNTARLESIFITKTNAFKSSVVKNKAVVTGLERCGKSDMVR